MNAYALRGGISSAMSEGPYPLDGFAVGQGPITVGRLDRQVNMDGRTLDDLWSIMYNTILNSANR